MRTHYKSWSGLKKELEGFLCDSLRNRVTYFLTYYHQVHNSYGRASIRLDGKDRVIFSWREQDKQEWESAEAYKSPGNSKSYSAVIEELRGQWDANCTYSEADFIKTVQQYLNMPIGKAHSSDNSIIRILAILDRRTGRRTLDRLNESQEFLSSPEWARIFYRLRFEVEEISADRN